ncbi:MAG: L-threonylcarbamoyladenylate synthase [Desulfobacteraceae bacterium]
MPRPQVINVTDKAGLDQGLKAAADTLALGGVVALPTESFYGLCVDVRREDAIRRLFLIKKRDPERPVLLLAASEEQALGYFKGPVSRTVRRLMAKFWPGGLTLVYWAGPAVNPLLTGRTDKIGVRVSGHPIPRAVAESLGGAVTGTSANLSGLEPCTLAGEVVEAVGPDIDLLLDGGPTPGGSGSTVLDVTSDQPEVLRPGLVSREDIESVLLSG